MSVTETPRLDDESMAILHAGYLQRPASRHALREALTIEPTHFDITVDALVAAGFLHDERGTLSYESPYTTFTAIGRARAERMQDETSRTVALMGALPQLIRAWDLSEVDADGDHPLAVNVIHAHSGSWDEWFRHAAAEAPHRPSSIFTDPAVLVTALKSGHLAALQSSLEGSTQNVRVLIPGTADWLQTGLALIDDARQLGIEFRTSNRLASWLYVDEPGLVGLPIMWGNGTPTSTMAIRTPPIVSAVSALFDVLWDRAEPLDGDQEAWEIVVRMLARGLTDDAIARALGLTTRTVRRRIAEAMCALDVTSRFTLGAAWQARRSS